MWHDWRHGAHGAFGQWALEAAQPGATVQRERALLLAQRAQLHNQYNILITIDVCVSAEVIAKDCWPAGCIARRPVLNWASIFSLFALTIGFE